MKNITIEAVTKEAKEYNGERTWGVKVGGSWLDLHVAYRPEKGQTFEVETSNVEWKGKTYVHARPIHTQQLNDHKAPMPASTPPPIAFNYWETMAKPKASASPVNTIAGRGPRATPYSQNFEAFEAIARRAHAVAKELEPEGLEAAARARMAFVASFLIAFGDGKLVMDEAIGEESDWGQMAPAAPVVKPETNEAHLHLQKTIWDYCEKTGKVAGHDLVILKQVSGHEGWFNMTEKEAIAARLKVEELIDATTDYKSELTQEVKKHFATQGWNFADATPDNLARKQTILRELGITGPFKDATNGEAKAALAKLRDPNFLPF